MEKIHLVLFLAFWSASVISQTQACSTPPVVDNAFISENEKIGNYSEGDIVYYTCHPGYISRGRLRYKCQDEEWTQSRLLKCTPKPCGHPGDIINGRFHLVNNTEFLYGVQVKYTCNEGYQMASQMDFRVCLDNGWSNDVPHCEVKTCIPQKPEAGIIITSGKFESDEPIPYGNVLKFECSSSDFTIDGESEVHCKADGNWSSPFPTCKDYFINTADVLSGNASREKTPAVTYPTLTGFCPDVITDTLHGLKKCNPVIGVPVIYLPSTGEELLNWVEEGGVWWKKM